MAVPEKTAIRISTRPLVDGLAEEDIDSIADDLKDNNLISSTTKQGFTKIKKQKARDVVTNVTGKVNANTKNFMKSIKVLKDNELPGLAKLLKNKIGKSPPRATATQFNNYIFRQEVETSG